MTIYMSSGQPSCHYPGNHPVISATPNPDIYTEDTFVHFSEWGKGPLLGIQDRVF